MFKAVQILALIQGLFLIFLLLKKKEQYKKLPLILLICCVASIVFYILGDDDNNLFVEGLDLFLFDTSLFVTFLLLFSIQLKEDYQILPKKLYLLFLPNLVYFTIEAVETRITENTIIEMGEFAVELTFTAYLGIILYSVWKSKSRQWLALFVSFIFLILLTARVNEILGFMGYEEVLKMDHYYYDSALHLAVAFLFYFMVYKLVLSKANFLPEFEAIKYSKSPLSKKQIESYKEALIDLMEKDKIYMDRTLSIQSLSVKLAIPKQYISEILNVHMKTTFSDFVNQYRVEEFTVLLQKSEYANYTFVAIANEVGFNSKATFNATFKKIKGTTPNEYKKSILPSK